MGREGQELWGALRAVGGIRKVAQCRALQRRQRGTVLKQLETRTPRGGQRSRECGRDTFSWVWG